MTSEHRSEDLQRTPLAISAFDSQRLEQTQVKSVRDLAGQVPNLGLGRNSIGHSTQTYSIRGIGESDPIQEAAVAVYADDLYIPRAIGSMVDFNDVERVEVLRGPQGTLYGRNSS
ncbi:TonB-dependent receptor plug domain-containing protein, partial [Pandoraea sputorum]|uniref:TonB-dependent receptor plug domain-containing protein n=1 Tax=Pandoraea sputorum TaxID=93222 RepID=UPI0035589194